MSTIFRYDGLASLKAQAGLAPVPFTQAAALQAPVLEQHRKKIPDFVQPEVVKQRRKSLGMEDPLIEEFINQTEFVSLGCFCGVASALRALGLHRLAYPFDWVRSDISGIIYCLESEFEDFMQYSHIIEHEASKCRVYTGTPWGGSFWHHNPDDEKTKVDFTRRIDRFYGNEEVPAEKARVFCLTLNATSDFKLIPKLRAKLEDQFPEAEVYLIVFIDNQPHAQPVLRVEGDQNMVFVFTSTNLFGDDGKSWSEKEHAETYAEGIAAAIAFWSGANDSLAQVGSMRAVRSSLRNFEGPDPGTENYWPFPEGENPFDEREGSDREARDTSGQWRMLSMGFFGSCAPFVDDDDLETDAKHSAICGQ